MANPLTSIKGTVKWNGVEVAHARGWTINITAENQKYASNKTKGKRGCRPGIITVSGTFRTYAADGAPSPPAYPGQIARLQLYTDDTNYWDIVNAIIDGVNHAVENETGALVGYEFTWSFAGKDDATGGSIKAPDGTMLDSSIVGEIGS